jgi:hypothetical protein
LAVGVFLHSGVSLFGSACVWLANSARKKMPVVEEVTVKTEPKKAAGNPAAQVAGFIVGTVLIVLLALGFLVFVYVVGQGLAGSG